MSDATLIEVAGEAVAIVIPEEDRYRFVAVKQSVWPLDDRLYASPEDARRAAQAVTRSPAFGPRRPLRAHMT